MTKIFITWMILMLLTGCAHKVDVPMEDTVIVPEEVIITQDESEEVVEEVEEVVEEEPDVRIFRVTAYCPCEICCGKWAKNRPIGEDGKPIVIGAWGKELTDGFSCASPMAFGTQVEINGLGTLEVQDRTADWIVEEHGEYIIDVYMTDHEAALKFGVQFLEGVIK